MGCPGFGISFSQLVRKYQGVGDLIHLKTATCRPAIEPGILRKASVRFLLYVEQIIERTFGSFSVPERHLRSRNFVEIPSPNRMISSRSGLVCTWPPAPRRGERSHGCPLMSFVFVRFQNHRCHFNFGPVAGYCRSKLFGIFVPASQIFMIYRVEALAKRGLSTGKRFIGIPAKRQSEGKTPWSFHAAHLHDIAVDSLVIDAGEMPICF